ncbi:MAG: hypothetical protein F9K29_15930 [Hyphomicrobiaceae bacterium]|nr:MAG: hypothetical protein F9K29_15930 [Hyphomicrobiaceae bacterium]
MIYRILVDNAWTVFLVPPGISSKQLVRDLHRKGILPTEVWRRLESLSQAAPVAEAEYDSVWLRLAARPIDEKRRLIGAGFGALARIMDERGLKAPALENPRARFYFTDLGWQRVGRFVAGRARQMGHVVKVIRRKNPPSSQIAYRDAYQLAHLPSRLRR